jgi:hypothetical protein
MTIVCTYMRQFVLVRCSMVLKDFTVGCLLLTVNDVLDVNGFKIIVVSNRI